MRVFVKAEPGKNNTVIYHGNDGTRLIRSEGTRTWRNTNPGNVRTGGFAQSNGAIGEASRFAIFPDYLTGRRACSRLLRTKKYWGRSIYDAIELYAPPADKNDVANYHKLIRQFTGLDINRKLKSLRTFEFQKLLDAIQRIEGWKIGREELIRPKKITAVRSDRHGILQSYQIDGKNWLSKTELIARIESEGGIDAVVVRRKGISPFIRMRPDSIRLNNLNVSNRV